MRVARKLLRNLSRTVEQSPLDGVLWELGLERRDRSGTVMTTIGIFAAGVLAGAVLSLLLAPESGRELRSGIARRVDGLREGVSERVQSVAKRGERYNPPS